MVSDKDEKPANVLRYLKWHFLYVAETNFSSLARAIVCLEPPLVLPIETAPNLKQSTTSPARTIIVLPLIPSDPTTVPEEF